ncbi:MAG: Cobalamin biosynthesis protein CobD/CbiB [Candidatus Methanohalarchaeum thermophilum]|uniref:Probable cobalamin biosynthesis protein CobD n=1 Tax=Methanohalarchaeum thermophilum TaxID=1903181 RepID=A0A1Q6DVP6_METT1|nr:MAG: Cobalamin biosynthesis protein CobD/CbiB [Candidatus Methanohalarchaeum thermophilum]
MNYVYFRLTVILLAIVFDHLGELPESIHPVVWIGKLTSFLDKRTKNKRNKLVGFFNTFLISLSFTVPVFFIPSKIVFILPSAIIASTMFSISSLKKMVIDTTERNLEVKRRYVSKLVSRDVDKLDKGELNSAAVETAGENITDSVIAPLFYYFLFGLPGIVFYRAINTQDAMIGYKTDEFLDYGWFAARTDDFLNYLPSRITGFLILLSENKLKEINKLLKYKNIKLNPGWTIGAIAVALNCRITKRGYYDINSTKSYPSEKDIVKSTKVIYKTSLIFILISFIFLYLLGVLRIV